MNQIPLEVSWELSTDSGKIEDLFSDLIKESDFAPPVRVISDCDYAEFVEFGTRPYAGSRSTPAGSSDIPRRPTAVNQKFRDWAAVKLTGQAASEGKTTDRLGDEVYHSIMQNGLDPHPYLRPALYDVLDEADEEYLTKGGSFSHIAADIVDRAKENLDSMGAIYTGELKSSLKIEVGFNENEDETASDNGLSDEVWKSRELGVPVNGTNKRVDFARRRS